MADFMRREWSPEVGDYVTTKMTQLADGSYVPAVKTATPSAPLTGQAKIATTGTSVKLAASSTPLVNGIIVKALTTNAAAIVVGPSGVANTTDGTGNGYILQPGEAMSFAVADASAVYINGTSGDGVSWGGN